MGQRHELMDRAFVYILRCSDGSLYTGITRRSVDERVSEHNAGLVDSFTSIRRPVALIHSEAHLRIDEAIATERRIKRRSKNERVPASFDTGPSGPAQDEDRRERRGSHPSTTAHEPVQDRDR